MRLLIPILLILLIPFLMVSMLFGEPLWENRELYRVESPDGSRWAVVMESDQGAMGGATYVEVDGERIFTGPWSIHESIQVTWQDDNTLLIDGVAYFIAE